MQQVGERWRIRRHPVRDAVEAQLRLAGAPHETAEEAAGCRMLGLAHGEGDSRGLLEAPVGVDDRAGRSLEVGERGLVALVRLLVDPVPSVQLLRPAMMRTDELRERRVTFEGRLRAVGV